MHENLNLKSVVGFAMMNLSEPSIIATIRRIRTLSRLDAYGLAIANSSHVWTNRERKEFERRVRELRD